MQHRLFSALLPLFSHAIAERTFPGAAVGVRLCHDQLSQDCLFCFGRDRFAGGRAVDLRTCYDLASLTKPLATTLCILSLIKAKSLRLDSRVNEFLGKHRLDNLAGITIYDLLNHRAGLPAYHDFYSTLAGSNCQDKKKKILEIISRLPVDISDNRLQIYSDIGFILLGLICEHVSHMPLDRFAEQYIYAPIGLADKLFFNRLGNRKEVPYAPTEECRWRRELLIGQVHDENAWSLGGVAGHAGLFGSVGGVLELVGLLLGIIKGRKEHPNIARDDLRQAVARQNEGGTWGLGFDTRSEVGSSSGGYLSKNSFGHLGFTGTSFWVDPERDMAVVLLSNRVHPRRDNLKIKGFRPRFHDAVLLAVGAAAG